MLKLRSNFDKQKQTNEVKTQNTQRHKGYLKEMLIQKYMSKYNIDMFPPQMRNQPEMAGQISRELSKISMFINQHFDDFIESGSFTQAKLSGFERDLLTKLNAFIQKEGIDSNLGPTKTKKITNELFEQRSLSSNYRPSVINNLTNADLTTIQRNSINRNVRGT